MNHERIGSLIWRLIYPILIFIGAELIVEIIAMLFFVMPGLNDGTFVNLSQEEITEMAKNFITENALYIVIARAVILTPICCILMKYDDKTDVRYGRYVTYEEYNKNWLWLLIPAGIGAAIGFNGLISVSGIEAYSEGYKEVAKATYSGSVGIQILASAIAAPLVEELVMRGLLYKRLRHHMNSIWCMLITATMFGLIHGNIVQFLYAFLVGILLGYVFEKFKTLWAPVIFHSAANLISIIITIVLGKMEKELTLGAVMLISVIALAVATLALKFIDIKVNRCVKTD